MVTNENWIKLLVLFEVDISQPSKEMVEEVNYSVIDQIAESITSVWCVIQENITFMCISAHHLVTSLNYNLSSKHFKKGKQSKVYSEE